MVELTWFNFLTTCVIVSTIWLAYWRMHGGNLDSSVPLVYYIFLVLYVRGFEDEYEKYVIFASVISALLLRFEFMGGAVLKLIRTVEFVCLCYVVFRGVELLFTPH
jgi:hypothetical protein